MRWPWQREHPRETPSPAAAGATVQRADAPSPMGWAFLPPLQRSIASPELITRPSQFPHTLPAWRDPSFSSHDLSHVVSPAAPSGVIDGDGTGGPVQRAAHPDMPLLLPPPPKAPVVQRSVAEPPVAAPAPAPQRSYTRTSTEHLPVLQLAAVEPTPAPEPAPTPEPVADVAPETTPDQDAGDTAGQEAPVPGFEARSARTSTSGGLEAGSGSEPLTTPTLGASETAGTAAVLQRSTDLTAPAAPPAPEPRRRYGLGAPLASVPPSSTAVQRDVEGSTAAVTPVPAPTPTTSSDTISDPEPTSTPDASSAGSDDVEAPAAGEPLPDHPTLQRATTPTTLAPETAAGAAPVQRSALHTPGDGHHHGDPSVQASRVPGLEARTSTSGAEAPSSSSTSGAVVQRSRPGIDLPVAPSRPAVDGLEARSARTSTSGAEEPTPVVAAEEPQAPAPSDLPLAVTGSEPEVPQAETAPVDASDAARAADPPPATAPVLSASAPVQRSVDTVEEPTTRPLLGGPGASLTLLTPSSTAPTPVSAVGSASVGPAGAAAPAVTVSRSATQAPIVTGRTVPTVSRAIGMPSLPAVPSMPALPTVPSLPSAPSLPALPTDLPTDVPSMPAMPTAPALPGLPSVPSVPGIPGVQGLPSLPLAPTGGPTNEATSTAEGPMIPGEPVLDPRSSGGATEVPIGGGTGSAPGQAAAATAAPTGGAAASGAGAHGGSSDDMEALAQKLLSPMLRRIKAELLLDRERRGLRTDSW